MTFEHGQPEELLALMDNFKTSFDGIGTTPAEGKIDYLRNLLCGVELREFDKLAIQNTGTSNAHFKLILEGLLGCFFQLKHFPSRSARCTVQCLNLAKSLSNSLMPVSWNSITTSLYLPARAPPRRYPTNKSTRFSYTLSQTAGQNSPS